MLRSSLRSQVLSRSQGWSCRDMGQKTLLLIKESVITAHDSHYAGGIHLFDCLARSVSSSQHVEAVHVLSIASKAVILHYAVTHSLLAQLQTQTLTCGAELVSWQETQTLCHHVVVRDQLLTAHTSTGSGTSTSAAQDAKSSATSHRVLPPAAAAALLAAVETVVQKLTEAGCTGLVVLDVDTLQHAQVPAELLPAASFQISQEQYACSSSSRSSSSSSSSRNDSDGCCCCCCCTGQQPSAHPEPLRRSRYDQHQQQQQQQPPPPREGNEKQASFMLALASILQHQHHHADCTQATSAPELKMHPTQHQGHQHQQQHQQLANGMCASWPLLALVQNIHHLPFGPCGTAPRSLSTLQAWRAVAGVMCVSDFVRRYCYQHMLPLLPQLQLQRVHAVHPAAFGVWGEGPFEDLGSKGAADIWGQAETEQQQQQQQQQQQEVSPPAPAHPQQQQTQQQTQRWQQIPVAGMLKLTREKGSELFLSLAAQMPDLRFKAVCADPWVEQQVAQAGGINNIQLVPPQADVSAVLQGMSVLLVPSVLHEAFGMVTLDALLHGLPVIVAEAGALLEATAGAAAAVMPVSMVTFPLVQRQPLRTALLISGALAGAAAAALTSAPPLSAGEAKAADGCKAVESTRSESLPMQVNWCGNPGTSEGTPVEQLPVEVAGSCAAHCVQCWLVQQRSWDRRQFAPQQQEHVDSWAAAIRQLLGSREAYMQASGRSRAAAEQVLQQGPRQLAGLSGWLDQLWTEML